MSRPEPSAADLAALPRLPVDDDGPVFAEPWQAQAFAMAVQLNADGQPSPGASGRRRCRRSWRRRTAADGAAEHYYDHWLAALERLVKARGLASGEALSERKEAWAEAYRTTLHGKPVELPA